MLAEARQLEKCPCRSGDNFGQEARNVQCTILAAPWIQKGCRRYRSGTGKLEWQRILIQIASFASFFYSFLGHTFMIYEASSTAWSWTDYYSRAE